MSKEVLVDKYGNEFVKIEVKYNNKAQSIVMNDWRIGGCKWNDVDNGKFLTLLVNKKDLMNELGVNKQISDLEAKLAEMERCAENNKKVAELVSAEHNAKIEKLEQQLAEKEKELTRLKKNWNNSKTQQQRLYYNLKQNQYQDKIELLENIKEMVKNMSIGIGIEIYGTRIKPVEDYIDNQIKAIKGDK